LASITLGAELEREANSMAGDGFSGEEVCWSAAEKKIARRAFDKAYQPQCAGILAKARKMLATASVSSDLWKIHDYLSVQRHTTDRTYDYRYSVLFNVFARLLREKWLNIADLAGLEENKIERIQESVDFWRGRR
jgi:Photoprotection regulator fluorescence recovery protein